MNTARVALANLRFLSTPDESIRLAAQAIDQAGAEQADIICFPECYVPGYRARGRFIPSKSGKKRALLSLRISFSHEDF